MSNFNYGEALLQLINSLSKSEKRYFKIYSNRVSTHKRGFQFISLFDILDKHKHFDPSKIDRAIPDISPKQLSDLKRHLYKQLLECLRIYNANNEGFRISSEIERARVLYKKGLFHDCLYILKKAKEEALRCQQHIIVHKIIDFEKEIESRHITRSHYKRSEELEFETSSIRSIIRSEADWSEFSLKLYAKFIEKGHVKNQEEQEELSNYFDQHKPLKRVGSSRYFFESLYFHQAHEWHYFIIQNFAAGYRHSKLWVELFDKFPSFKTSHPHLYIKGLHNCLSVLYNCTDYNRHQYYLNELKAFINSAPKFDNNTKQIAFIYLNIAELNGIVLSGDFSKSKAYLINLEQELSQLDGTIDDYRLMVFWYKMACIYFTMGDYGNCNRLLYKITNPNQRKLREDLQCFSRLLSIISHFELGNDELLAHLIKSTYRFLLKMNEVTIIHETIIHFLRTSLFKERDELKADFIKLKRKFEDLNENPFERRHFLYLDVISWLESKIENKPVETIIYEKRKKASTIGKNS